MGSGISPTTLDAKSDRLMTNPVRGLKLFIRIELLPSLGDQQKQIWTVDRHFAGEYRKAELTPHDM